MRPSGVRYDHQRTVRGRTAGGRVAASHAMRWVAAVAIALSCVSLTGRAQEPVFRAGVDLVTVDAIVVDDDGRPVTGLTADDFLLTVDGKPRQIDAFEL